MAQMILAAGAAYLGFRAARKARAAYRKSKQEMYEEQELNNYYTQQYYNSTQPIGYNGRHHPSSGHANRNGYPYPPGNSYPSGRAYNYGY
jgi:hypothetical protein